MPGNVDEGAGASVVEVDFVIDDVDEVDDVVSTTGGEVDVVPESSTNARPLGTSDDDAACSRAPPLTAVTSATAAIRMGRRKGRMCTAAVSAAIDRT